MTRGIKEVPGGFEVVNIPVVAGLPFTRPILVKQDQRQQDTNEILFAGLDPSITINGLKSSIGIQKDVKIRLTQSYQTSKLEANRVDGFKDSTRLAFLSFPDTKSKDAVLQHLNQESLQPIPLHVDCLECRLAERLHRYHDVDALQRHLDDYMEEYDASLDNSKGKGQIVDDEGFTLVASNSTARSPDGIVVQSFKPKNQSIGSKANVFLKSANLTGASDAKTVKRKGGKEADFYRFQIRQQKEDDYLSLKRKREHDNELLEEMKRKRKFKQV